MDIAECNETLLSVEKIFRQQQDQHFQPSCTVSHGFAQNVKFCGEMATVWSS